MLPANGQITQDNFLPLDLGGAGPGRYSQAARVTVRKRLEIQYGGGGSIHQEQELRAGNADPNDGQAITGFQRNFFRMNNRAGGYGEEEKSGPQHDALQRLRPVSHKNERSCYYIFVR